MTGRALLAVVALAACDNGSGPPPPQASNLRVLHAIRGGPSLTVFVDGGRRLRLASFVPSAPGVHGYRTQPGSATLVASAAPLNFRVVTRYFDGALGSWSVVISHAGTTDTLLATGPLVLGDEQAQTLVVLDSTAGVTWRLLRDRD